jgi:PAS domain S-box-containing protein
MEAINANLYRSVFEIIPSGIHAVDRAGEVIFWNEAAEKITRHLRQDVLGGVVTENFLSILTRKTIRWSEATFRL